LRIFAIRPAMGRLYAPSDRFAKTGLKALGLGRPVALPNKEI